ncbi:MAG: bifunctional metallophosphatase/5'-nucleotidase [Spirochaetaceae bacterium]|nr:MAG: bifunctional metallophosphatase/5'-nucleotidase [Spirochaetaceae bacterium]
MWKFSYAQRLLWITALGVVLTLSVTAAEPDIVILHSNDIHGRIETDDGVLGMPYISALIRQHRAEHEHVLVLDAGDTIHGRPVANQLEGHSVVATMNAAGYDFMVPGNHDFNFGYQRLLELEEEMEFQLLAANVYKDGELLFAPYAIHEVGPYRVGIFGLATPDTYQTTHPRNIEGIEFASMIEAAEHYVTILQQQNVDLIIALGHVGFGRNYPSTDVADAVDGIHLFVDGHSHTLLPEGRYHNNTLFVQAHEYGKYLGRVEVFLSGDRPEFSASLIPAAGVTDIEPDMEITEMLEDFRAEVRRQILGI